MYLIILIITAWTCSYFQITLLTVRDQSRASLLGHPSSTFSSGAGALMDTVSACQVTFVLSQSSQQSLKARYFSSGVFSCLE